jgi:hypothetical protein
MQLSCSVFLLIIDIVCGLVIPIYETLFYLRYYRYRKQYNSKLTHWTTYWIFYSLLHLIQRLLYFFPFSYEIRVIATLLMAHPRIEAASLIYNFLVTNPLITIKIIDARNRIREYLDKSVLPKIANFRIL